MVRTEDESRNDPVEVADKGLEHCKDDPVEQGGLQDDLPLLGERSYHRHSRHDLLDCRSRDRKELVDHANLSGDQKELRVDRNYCCNRQQEEEDHGSHEEDRRVGNRSLEEGSAHRSKAMEEDNADQGREEAYLFREDQVNNGREEEAPHDVGSLEAVVLDQSFLRWEEGHFQVPQVQPDSFVCEIVSPDQGVR